MVCMYPTPRKVRKLDGTLVPVITECGYCVMCRLKKKVSYAVRMMHEACYNKKNCFITLTYGLTPSKEAQFLQTGFSNEEDKFIFRELNSTLPIDRNLNKEHLKKFFKRLRKAGYKFKYFACGEYGDNFGRAHYHVNIFGENFAPACSSKNGKCTAVAICKKLNNCDYRKLYHTWGYGYVYCGSFTSASAEYVAGYVLKKLTGKWKRESQNAGIVDEFALMSTRPALGKDYLDEIIIPNKMTTVRYKGHDVALPRYYADKLYAKYPIIKENRKQSTLEYLESKMLCSEGYYKERKKLEQIRLNKVKSIELKGSSLR